MPSRPSQQYAKQEWYFFAAVLTLAVFTLIRTRGLPLGPRLNILVVVVATPAAAAYLVKGILMSFSKHGGLRAALPLFAWSASMLLLALSSLLKNESTVGATYMIGCCALFAVIAAVLQQRVRESSEQ
jgi:hypothetical protein